MLEALDAFRRPQQLAQFLPACEADSRGRTGFEERPYPQADILRQAAAAARAVDVPALLSDNKVVSRSPEAIKTRIAQARSQAIARALQR